MALMAYVVATSKGGMVATSSYSYVAALQWNIKSIECKNSQEQGRRGAQREDWEERAALVVAGLVMLMV